MIVIFICSHEVACHGLWALWGRLHTLSRTLSFYSFLWLSWHLLGKEARWAEKRKRDSWEDIITRNIALIAWPQGTLCWLFSHSQRERALWSLIRFQFQLWFHLKSDLSEVTGVNASEMEQMLGNASKAEAVLHYMTRFWQGKAKGPGIWSALVPQQPELRPWGKTPEFRANRASLEPRR